MQGLDSLWAELQDAPMNMVLPEEEDNIFKVIDITKGKQGEHKPSLIVKRKINGEDKSFQVTKN